MKLLKTASCVLIFCITILGGPTSSHETLNSLMHVKRAAIHPAIGFTAELSSSISLVNQQAAMFDRVITNDGNGYDRTSGMFTAPVRGLYWFSVTVMGARGGEVSVEITKNGVAVGRCNGSRYGSTSIVLRLDVGDTVNIRHFVPSAGAEEMFGGWCSFSGLLIAQE